MIIDNVFSKRKSERRKSDIDIDDDSWEVVSHTWVSSKGKPVGMIWNTY